jgi:hypothetical protein
MRQIVRQQFNENYTISAFENCLSKCINVFIEN